MKRHLASLVLVVVAAALSGCYYDPGYSYVRSSGQGGDAYYGRTSTTYYAAPSYYGGYGGYGYGGYGYGGYGYGGNGYYGNGYYGGYGSGVSIGIRNSYYARPHYRHDYRRDRGHGGRNDHRGRSDHRGPRGQSTRGGRPSSNRPQGDRAPRSGPNRRDHGSDRSRSYRH